MLNSTYHKGAPTALYPCLCPLTNHLLSHLVLKGQKYFQCIYFPGKNAQYPLRPFTPAMPPPMMSPALRSMLEQHRATRTAGQ